ncbi:oligopeptidase A [Bowmanella sp. JS7-9]|uniref:oligopeptidase A n=1 Tax=Pseudobowmanella zhangzhouensis TaxID=1537679 RepID=A0ABW1XQ44_9ALTE|nr:oligopeptidase A [Bowmanella sp. JS7-9]TBX23816.1 oligopeptidase A [Bowmanella sp. JS7-9]
MSTSVAQAFALPTFSAISPDQIKPAVEQAISHCKSVIEQAVASGDVSYAGLILPIEQADDELSQLWSPVSHMNSVVSSDALREAHDSCLPLLSEYGTWVGQHEGLFAAYQALRNSNEFSTLSQAQQKAIDNTLRDFRLSGIDLPAGDKKRYAEISARLSELSSQFSNNLMDATLGWSKHIEDDSMLAGLPESARAAAAQAARQRDLQGWLFTLDIPSYLPVMMYADNRELREEMYRAYTTRASDQGPNAGQWDNSAIMQETLTFRLEKAKLLGFANYAEYSLATKMASSTEQVLTFLHDLARRSKPQGEEDLQAVRDFAERMDGSRDLQAWDLAYYSEKLKQAKYAISDEELRPYFPEHKVVSGLFEVVQRLYGLRIESVSDVDTWHPDVRFYAIYDSQQQLRGGFYFDLYARAKKRGGAWMDVCRDKRQTISGAQLPVAYLTCNFNGPVDGKPALFTHDEVVTLFHEFGHGLHHMLTQIDVGGVNGISGVPWDAVELPSQFLENWCWQPEALSFLSGHYESGKALPEDLLNKMLAARNYQSAMQMLRQLEFALFDFILHRDFDPAITGQVEQVLSEVRQQVSVVQPPEFNRFQHSFGHIFAGGYAAGYYSYKWAEVLSADAFSRFEEEGIFNPQTGADFMHCILEKGGSDEPMALFEAFRGRKPEVDALLRHSGING